MGHIALLFVDSNDSNSVLHELLADSLPTGYLSIYLKRYFIYLFIYLSICISLGLIFYFHICLTKVKACDQMSMFLYLTLKIGEMFCMDEMLSDEY